MGWFGKALESGISGLVSGLPGALFGAGTSLIGSLIGNNMNRSNVAAEHAWQEKMNLQQQNWQEDMWNKTNEYNSPVNQMQRLMDAGVNPNAAAGMIAGGNTQSQLAQQPQIPAGNPLAAPAPDLVGSISTMMQAQKDMELKQAQKENIESQTAANLQSVDTQKAQSKVYDAQAEGLTIENLYKPEQMQEGIRVLKSQADNYIVQTDLTKAEKAQADYMLQEILPLQKKMTAEQIKETVAKASAAFAAAMASKAQAGLANAQAKTEEKKQDLLEKQTEGQNIANQQNALNLGLDKNFKAMERLLGLRNNVQAIRNLELTNDEKEYLVKQFKSYGMPVDMYNVSGITKLAMLNAIGYGDTELVGPSATSSLWYGSQEAATGFLSNIFSTAMDAAKYAVGGAAAGRGMSVGNKRMSTVSVEYGTGSSSTWNR